MAEIDLGMNLYDFNKMGMNNEKPLDTIALKNKINHIFEDIMHRNSNQCYWMLLCRERNDYTVFIPLTLAGSEKEMLECLNTRGQVLSIDKQKDGNYEIWIRDNDTKENFAYYFFNYEFGIVKA